MKPETTQVHGRQVLFQRVKHGSGPKLQVRSWHFLLESNAIKKHDQFAAEGVACEVEKIGAFYYLVPTEKGKE